MQQFKEQFAAKFNFKPRLDELWYLLTYVNKLQMDVHSEGEVFCDGAVKGRKSELKSTASQFLLKVSDRYHTSCFNLMPLRTIVSLRSLTVAINSLKLG